MSAKTDDATASMAQATCSAFPAEHRYARNADETPALRCGLLLSESQAAALNAWFTARCERLKADGWRDWNEGDMALRTICVQIDAFSGRAFRPTNGKLSV